MKNYKSPYLNYKIKEPIKIAIAGLGHQGEKHLAACQNLIKNKIVEIAAVCDADSLKLEPFLEQFPCYSSYEEMVEKEKFNILILVFPHILHTSVVKDALKRNIHVLKEKPFALTLEEASDLAKLAKLKRCNLKVAQQRLFHPFYLKARENIKRLGRIRYLDYSFSLNDNTDSWYWKKSQGGGCWHGLGWHGCWVLHFFLGLPKFVQLQSFSGKKRTILYDTDDTNLFSCTYDSGIIGRLFLSVSYPFKKEEVFIEGEMGSLQLNRNSLQIFDEKGKELIVDNTQFDWNFAYEHQIESYVSEVITGKFNVDKASWEVMLIYDAGTRGLNSQNRSISIE